MDILPNSGPLKAGEGITTGCGLSSGDCGLSSVGWATVDEKALKCKTSTHLT